MEDEMREEYDFSKGVRGTHHKHHAEIHNFICARCGEAIPHADFKYTTATLSRNHKGVVMICGDCINSTHKRPVVVSVESRIR